MYQEITRIDNPPGRCYSYIRVDLQYPIHRLPDYCYFPLDSTPEAYVITECLELAWARLTKQLYIGNGLFYILERLVYIIIHI